MVPIDRVGLQLDFVAPTRVRQVVLHFDPLDDTPSLRGGAFGVFRNDSEPWFEVEEPPGRYRLRVEAPQHAERRDLFVLPATHEIDVRRDTPPPRCASPPRTADASGWRSSTRAGCRCAASPS